MVFHLFPHELYSLAIAIVKQKKKKASFFLKNEKQKTTLGNLIMQLALVLA